ncbi:E1 ubiquitin-activating protein uba2 [Lithohypha guttulata]|uniref:Ubiquitin-activating enzyme E1-like n=1 Tax=Lithohypha guttulata TaxID=1690604 RepID=A0AAN7SX40_9EURO|nr:E1 ubiquitin-activating protein uba2 [Lithohypha guttulata]
MTDSHSTSNPKQKQVVARERFQHRALGSTHDQLKKARVLLVGAGGIGCELLKNLVKSGFKEIVIIDLDTIDLSNLNRQFLFRHEHIKKPKALVAKEVARKFDPRATIVAHHANIKDEQFNVEWFAAFTIVFNALDNLDARRHVNRMCLAADVPLIESGTTGYNGNVQVIKRGKTACYDCKEKQVPKSFAICTIRSTPSQPIHTIVWAKSYLLPELFGVSEAAAMNLDTSESANNAEEIEKLEKETAQLRELREAMGSDDFVRKVFDQAYKKDVERLLSMEDYWKNKKAPIPLDYETIASGSENIDPLVAKLDQDVWTLQQTFTVFKDSLLRLSKRLAEERAAALRENQLEPVIEFDKDDEDTLDFVTAAANLRSAAFNIDPKSKFDTKQMAGNIIPAIATTNAMVASLCILQAYKVIKGDLGRTKELFLSKANMTGDSSDLPNPNCMVCSRVMMRTKIDLEKATVGDLVDILKLELDYTGDITITTESSQMTVFDYLDDDDDDEDSLAKRRDTKLVEVGVGNGTSLIVLDGGDDEPRVDLQLFVEDMNAEREQALVVKFVFNDGEKPEIPRKPAKKPTEMNGTTTLDGEAQSAATGSKRKRGQDDEVEESAPAKKLQTSANGATQEDDIIVIDDEGAIVLD